VRPVRDRPHRLPLGARSLLSSGSCLASVYSGRMTRCVECGHAYFAAKSTGNRSGLCAVCRLKKEGRPGPSSGEAARPEGDDARDPRRRVE